MYNSLPSGSKILLQKAKASLSAKIFPAFLNPITVFAETRRGSVSLHAFSPTGYKLEWHSLSPRSNFKKPAL